MYILVRAWIILFAIVISKAAIGLPISYEFDLTQQDNFLDIDGTGSFTVHTDDERLSDGLLYSFEISSIDLTLNENSVTFTNISGLLAFDYDDTKDQLSITAGVTGDPNTWDEYINGISSDYISSIQFGLGTGPYGYTNFSAAIPEYGQVEQCFSECGLFTVYSGDLNSVSEPGSLLLLAAGAMGLIFGVRVKSGSEK